jgi:hypothetical protein
LPTAAGLYNHKVPGFQIGDFCGIKMIGFTNRIEPDTDYEWIHIVDYIMPFVWLSIAVDGRNADLGSHLVTDLNQRFRGAGCG